MTWRIHCEHPGCASSLTIPPPQAFDDFEVRKQIRAHAENNGWYVTRDRGDRRNGTDLCPNHVPRGHR